MSKWYVVYTKSHAEQQAAVNLCNQGFNIYLPRYSKTLRHARRVSEVMRPLFPRYLFVELDLDNQAWNAVNGTLGVINLVSFGDKPTALPDSVMTDLQAREKEDGTILLTHPDLKKGDRLKIIDGALANMNGLFESMADNERAMLFLDFLGRTIRANTPLQFLEPA